MATRPTALAAWSTTAHAQDIEPRAYSNAPVGASLQVTVPWGQYDDNRLVSIFLADHFHRLAGKLFRLVNNAHVTPRVSPAKLPNPGSTARPIST